MNIPWLEIAGLSAAALSAVAAVGSWKSARTSNDTAVIVARIEQDRWHADLLPQFRINIERAEGDRATLSVHLVGPLPLCRLDEIRLAIVQSDDMTREARPPGEPTQEQLDAQVWGPFRFSHGADGADVDGRTVNPIALEVGAGRPFSIERTRPPHWQQGDDRGARWRDQWINRPMRLVLTCKREGFKPWIVPYEVEIPEGVRVRWVG
ncbi:hypothetical protein [Streptomyces triticiradicis]|uniref:Uncharacterized protein n=1 Tax=Streptomyces triticiradicis TaxID=2651189 RepID=A0A7J5D5E8_9ACTN|nr:hypothetical protein [Streptomyces triticiradicis]KAB1979454.1 hypothetical protein F8144_36175 [Streptomyces triticiradicis]